MDKELTLKEKWLSFREKHFPERQLFLRSEGRVRFLTIGSKTQMSMASAVSVAFIWGAVTSYAYLTRDTVLEEKNRTISNMSAQYQSLSSDFSSLEQEIERSAAQLEERQKFLETVVGIDPTTHQKDNDTPTPEEIPAVPSTEANDTDEISLFDELLGAKAAVAEVRPVLSNRERRARLFSRLRETSNKQQFLVAKLLANAKGHQREIEETLAPTKLTTDELLHHFDAEQSAIGGPYIPDQAFTSVFTTGDEQPFKDLIAANQRLEMVTLMLDSFPVGKPAEKYYLSSKFGRRRDPLKKTWANHPGLDLAGWPGTAIYATAPGKVVHAGWFGPYGRMVEVDHGNGFKTRYGHMRKLRVKKGEEVELGTRVGDMGKTGRVTGTHLHYEVWFDGQVRDPAPFMKAAENVLKIQGRDEKNSD